MLKYNFNSNCQKQPKVWISDDLKFFIFKVVFIAYTLYYKKTPLIFFILEFIVE